MFSLLSSKHQPKKISLEDIKKFVSSLETKRIHFASVHRGALHIQETEDVKAWLNLPFGDSINPLLSEKVGETSFVIENKFGRFCRPLQNEEQFKRYQSVIDQFRDVVFLKDCLDISIALSMNLDENGNFTTIGQAERNYKYNKDQGVADLRILVDALQTRLSQFPILSNVDYVCCIPTNNPVMQDVISRIQGFRFQDISSNVVWQNKFSSLKEATSVDEKLELLEQFRLQINIDVNGKDILLLDDLYQSGVTMQYVAMCLKDKGARFVYGITLVKARNNTTYNGEL